MKSKMLDEAKKLAKEKSLDKKHKDERIYLIYCNRTEYYYADTDSLVRLWERLIGYYENGIYTAEKSHK